jgi:hypothetical protein
MPWPRKIDALKLHLKNGFNFTPVLLTFNFAPGASTRLVPQASDGQG